MDLDANVFPYLEVISALNDVKVAPMEGNFNNLSTECLGREHLLIGSDICFWDSMGQAVVRRRRPSTRGRSQAVRHHRPGRPTFYELADRCQKQNWQVTLKEWYAVEPSRTTGEVLEVRPP